MKTKVFISWSGKDTESFNVAKRLADWLPKVLQNTSPFMSDNIPAGTNPIGQIMNHLADSKVGIICVTKENVNSPWLNFEAGALNNVVTTHSGVVIPILINMTTDEFASCNSPIKNLQGKIFDYNGIEQMLISINNCLEYPLSELQLNDIFDKWSSSLIDVQVSKQKIHSNSSHKSKSDQKEKNVSQSFEKTVEDRKPEKTIENDNSNHSLDLLSTNEEMVLKKLYNRINFNYFIGEVGMLYSELVLINIPGLSHDDIKNIVINLNKKGYLYSNIDINHELVYNMTQNGKEYCENKF